MSDYLGNLWAGPPANLQLRCPPPAPGEAIDPMGFFDPNVLRGAYRMATLSTAALVVLLVALCYLWTRSSLGPRFVLRWWIFLGGSMLGGFILGIAVLRMWPARALAGSCETNPTSFLVTIPWADALNRGVAGAVWAGLVFTLLSLVLTQLAGRFPWSGGLFHYRGCPYPRLMPFGE
jgi:hypothetical protein